MYDLLGMYISNMHVYNNSNNNIIIYGVMCRDLIKGNLIIKKI